MQIADGLRTMLNILDTRRSAEAVHAYLRELVQSGTLPAGTQLSQLKLAEALGVSRTPLQEAVRRLQEEGLIDAEPNKQCRVSGIDHGDLDTQYGSQLLLEAVEMRLTLSILGNAELRSAETTLHGMNASSAPCVSSN